MNNQVAYDGLKRLGSHHGGLLIVGHGTRSLEGQRQLLTLVQAMQICCPHTLMQPCFLELAEPSISAGVHRLSGKGIKRLLVVPVLLFTAAHAKEDIPNAVAQYAESLSIEIVGQSSPLNLHPQALALSQLRCSEVLAPDQDNDSIFESIKLRFDPRSNGAQTDDPQTSEIALVMIGRGTSQLDARDAMRKFVKLRCERYPVAWTKVGFFAGDEVSVTDALDLAALQTRTDTVVVQPHLLFEGDLSKHLMDMVTEYRAKYPLKKWLIANPLGSDERLGEAYLALAEEAVASCSY